MRLSASLAGLLLSGALYAAPTPAPVAMFLSRWDMPAQPVSPASTMAATVVVAKVLIVFMNVPFRKNGFGNSRNREPFSSGPAQSG